MGTIVCQSCNSTIDTYEDEKVTVLYSKCDGCHTDSKEEKQYKKKNLLEYERAEPVLRIQLFLLIVFLLLLASTASQSGIITSPCASKASQGESIAMTR